MSRLLALPLLPLLLAASLIGCARVDPTPYAPAEGSGYGYSDLKLGENSYRIEVRGNERTSKLTVEKQLTLRAAELALENGAERFVLTGVRTDRSAEKQPDSYISVPVKIGKYTSYSIQKIAGQTIVHYTATATAVFLTPDAEVSDDIEVYDANDVVQTLAALKTAPAASEQ